MGGLDGNEQGGKDAEVEIHAFLRSNSDDP
jgi:hypothetical protein